MKVGVITSPLAAPFVIYKPKDKKNTYQGIAIDIWEKIADFKQYDFEYVNAGDSYSTAIKNIGNYDILIGDFRKTPDRNKKVLFTIPFFMSKRTFVEKNENFTLEVFLYIIKFLASVLLIILFLTPFSFFLLKSQGHMKSSSFKEIADKNIFKSNFFLNFIDSFIFSALSIIYRKPSMFTPFTNIIKYASWFYAIIGIILISYFIAGMIEVFRDEYTNGNTPFKDKNILTWKNKSDTYKQINDAYAVPKPLKRPKSKRKRISTKPLLDEFVREDKNYDHLKIREDVAYFFKKNSSKYKDIQLNGKQIGWDALHFVLPKKSPHLEDINNTLLKLQERSDIKTIIKKHLGYSMSKYGMV